MPISHTQPVARSYTSIARRHKDGSVLLSIEHDRVCRLNGVGALTWLTLIESEKGFTLDEVVAELALKFKAINSEGELRYEVSSEQLWQDTKCFLSRLTELGFLKIDQNSERPNSYLISDGVTGTISPADCRHNESSLTKSTFRTAEPATIQPAFNGEMKPTWSETLTAFMGLAAFDFVLRVWGLRAVIRRVKRWPIAEPLSTDQLICERVCAMVDRAQLYYPNKAMCLQHSAVLTCLLRWRGVPAQMVLAAREFPPEGHAWVEVGDVVVNGKDNVKTKYCELERI